MTIGSVLAILTVSSILTRSTVLSRSAVDTILSILAVINSHATAL